MNPEDIGVGRQHGDPIAPSVDEYSEYPENQDEFTSNEYHFRSIIEEILAEVGGYAPWLRHEVGFSVPKGDLVGQYKGQTDFEHGELWIELQELHTPERKGYHNQYHQHLSYHVGTFGEAGPLESEKFLKAAHERNYSAVEISDLIYESAEDNVSEDEVQSALYEFGIEEKDFVDIDGERYEFEDIHFDPYKDRRILEACDSANWSIQDIADEFGVAEQDVTRQIRLHKLTEADDPERPEPKGSNRPQSRRAYGDDIVTATPDD